MTGRNSPGPALKKVFKEDDDDGEVEEIDPPQKETAPCIDIDSPSQVARYLATAPTSTNRIKQEVPSHTNNETSAGPQRDSKHKSLGFKSKPSSRGLQPPTASLGTGISSAETTVPNYMFKKNDNVWVTLMPNQQPHLATVQSVSVDDQGHEKYSVIYANFRKDEVLASQLARVDESLGRGKRKKFKKFSK
ncbi:hypothetical protein IV203_000081 [Nitzschia inconspicua]|uniref:Uncharacterized protein n=1 Tax=Nitzschia inconspicua TaxID=303405 RepID=A0A9K3L5V1_9STRA|nr:hypothetical protein IV203_000081 [Nitzschia inconspicua]